MSRVALGAMLDDLRLAQLPQPDVEHARVGPGGLLQTPEGQATAVPQLPEDAQGHAPAEQVEQRHDGPAGGRSTHATVRFRCSNDTNPVAKQSLR